MRVIEDTPRPIQEKLNALTPEQMKELRYAGLLHDFGKVGVREQVLVKAKKPDNDGLALSVTPESAGWKYVGFQVYRRAKGQDLNWKAEGRVRYIGITTSHGRRHGDRRPDPLALMKHQARI